MNKYNWKGISFPSEKDHWKKIENTNVTIALNVLYAKKEKKYILLVSKCNSDCEKQVILLMISNGELCRRLEILAVRAMSEGHEAKSRRQ